MESVMELAAEPLLGLALAELNWPLITGVDPKTALPDAAERFITARPDYVAEWYGKGPEKVDAFRRAWDGYWCHIPYEDMASVFSPAELVLLCRSTYISGAVNRYFREDRHASVLERIRLSLWQWSAFDSYDQYVALYRGLSRFDFGPGFETRLELPTNDVQSRGYPRTYDGMRGTFPSRPVFLDGALAYIVYHRGRHVLTISFSPVEAGLLVQQVQVREKRGNRWLFKLGRPLLAHAVHCLAAAFPDETLFIPDGKRAVARIRDSYGRTLTETGEHPFDAKGAAGRIEAFYDGPIEGYTRAESREFYHCITGSGLFHALRAETT